MAAGDAGCSSQRTRVASPGAVLTVPSSWKSEARPRGQIAGKGVRRGLGRRRAPRQGVPVARQPGQGLGVDLPERGGTAADAGDTLVVDDEDEKQHQPQARDGDEGQGSGDEAPDEHDGHGEEHAEPGVADALQLAVEAVALGGEAVTALAVDRGGQGW